MNQHSIQKAYLKTFADQSGRVWVYAKAGGRAVPKSPVQCAAEEDFQSPALEFYQNQVIEIPGIKALRVNGSLSPEEFEQMSMWAALHIIRTQKARQQFLSRTLTTSSVSTMSFGRSNCSPYTFVMRTPTQSPSQISWLHPMIP